MTARKTMPPTELELRRWCIEQAIKWPWDAGRMPSYAGGFPDPGRPASEPDILGRADRILVWVQLK